MEAFSQFRKDLTRKQKQLYQNLQEKRPGIAGEIFNSFKSEINEFIDCNPQKLLETQFVIKSEVAEIEELEEFEDLISFSSDPVCSKQKSGQKKKKKVHEIHKNIKEECAFELFCDVCGHKSLDKDGLESHMKIHLKKELENFYCEFCSREFEKVKLLLELTFQFLKYFFCSDTYSTVTSK